MSSNNVGKSDKSNKNSYIKLNNNGNGLLINQPTNVHNFCFQVIDEFINILYLVIAQCYPLKV